MGRIACFGCYSEGACSCSESWRRVCRFARDQAWQAKLPVFATNLRWAASLCAAFALGEYFERDTAIGGWRLERRWAPGCGVTAPVCGE